MPTGKQPMLYLPPYEKHIQSDYYQSNEATHVQSSLHTAKGLEVALGAIRNASTGKSSALRAKERTLDRGSEAEFLCVFLVGLFRNRHDQQSSLPQKGRR